MTDPREPEETPDRADHPPHPGHEPSQAQTVAYPPYPAPVYYPYPPYGHYYPYPPQAYYPAPAHGATENAAPPVDGAQAHAPPYPPQPGPAAWPQHPPAAYQPPPEYPPPAEGYQAPPPGYPPYGYLYPYPPQDYAAAPPGYSPQAYYPYPYPPPGYPPQPARKPPYEPPPGEYEYHRIPRSKRGFAHWRLPVAAPIFAGLYFASMIVLVIGIAVLFAADPVGLEEFLDRIEQVDLTDPWVFIFAMVSIIVWLPLLWASAAMLGYRPFGRFSSVQGRLRWGWLLRCTAVALGIYLVGFGALTAIEVALGESWGSMFEVDGRAILFILMVLLLVPFQATAEEYVFRGYLMQLAGSWVRYPIFAILFQVPLFAVAHGYGIGGTISVGLFALIAGCLVWRTGGLEAAIALHVVHNVIVMTVDVTSAPTEGADADMSWLGVVFILALEVVFAAWALWAAKRRRLPRTVQVEGQSIVP